MSQPKNIAVVISTYNKSDYLNLVLEGYRQQTSSLFSIYIADDGSSETTTALINKFKTDFPVPIHHYWHEDVGFRKSKIHNQVFSHIQEPYLLLTDGDCIPHQDLVKKHLKHAKSGFFINGSRILCNKKFTELLCTKKILFPTKPSRFFWLQQRLLGHINRIFPLFLLSIVNNKKQKLKGIRGCHLSCWTKDIININGFDETFEGWGREDSDLVARLFHSGVQRLDLLGTPVFHLWHPEEDKGSFNQNDQRLKQCLKEKRIKAIQGII